MQEPGRDILANFTNEEYKRARSLMVGAVLGTDMSKHFGEISKFKARIAAENYDPAGADKNLTMF
jgi:hypothetical protein